MDYKILRKSTDAVFEPHVLPDRELPFIYHLQKTSGRRVCNFHENPELLYILQGSGQVEYDTETYTVREGDLVAVNSYAVHQVVSHEPMRYVCLIIDSSFCRHHNIDINNLHFTELIRDASFEPLFRRLMEEYGAERAFRHTAVKLAVLDILLLLCRNYSCAQTAAMPVNESSQKRVRSAVGYIKRNIGRKLTVEEIASSVGVSQYHFMREFKRFTGCTLTNYINIIRCEYAKELLQTGQYRIKEVAFLCGFESESYFTNVFKGYAGIAPSEYRKGSLGQCH